MPESSISAQAIQNFRHAAANRRGIDHLDARARALRQRTSSAISSSPTIATPSCRLGLATFTNAHQDTAFEHMQDVCAQVVERVVVNRSV
jgi:hypothetical protein